MRARSQFIGYGIFLAALFVLQVAACTPKPDPEPRWRFHPDSIQLRYTADALLNHYNGSAHTLVMAVYQLSSREAFAECAQSEDGIRKLLEVRRFDPSLVGLERIIIQPGEERQIFLDRAENARWVGLAFGYYDLRVEQATRVFAVDYAVETTGRLRREKTAIVKPLIIDFRLGPTAIYTIGVLE